MLAPRRYYYCIFGDAVSLRCLATSFDRPPYLVFEYNGDCLLDADDLQLGNVDCDAADNVLRALEGALRAAGSGVATGLYVGGALYRETEKGPLQKSARVYASISVGACIVHAPTLQIDGVSAPSPRSLPLRIVDWLPGAGDKAVALHLMMVKGEPDWRDLSLIIEILNDLGYPSKRGVKNEIDLIKRTANNWKALGPESRHYEPNYSPPANPPSLREARSTVLRLVREWFEENAPA